MNSSPHFGRQYGNRAPDIPIQPGESLNNVGKWADAQLTTSKTRPGTSQYARNDKAKGAHLRMASTNYLQQPSRIGRALEINPYADGMAVSSPMPRSIYSSSERRDAININNPQQTTHDYRVEVGEYLDSQPDAHRENDLSTPRSAPTSESSISLSVGDVTPNPPAVETPYDHGNNRFDSYSVARFESCAQVDGPWSSKLPGFPIKGYKNGGQEGFAEF